MCIGDVQSKPTPDFAQPDLNSKEHDYIWNNALF